jgi:hypothetical protein
MTTYLLTSSGLNLTTEAGELLVLDGAEEVPETPDTVVVHDPSCTLNLIAGTGSYGGRWTGFPLTALGVWTDLQGEPRLVHGALDGVPYVHGVQGDGVYNDGFLAGDQPIAHAGEISPVGYDAKIEKQWDRVDLSMRLVTSCSDIQMSLNTPAGATAATALSFAGGLSYWDDAYWDTAVWSSVEVESHGAVGVNAIGRWCTVRFEHAVLDQTIGFLTMALEAFALGSYPATP